MDFVGYMQDKMIQLESPPAEAGAAVYAWAIAHLVAVFVWLATSLVDAPLDARLIMVSWSLLSSGLAYRTLRHAVLPEIPIRYSTPIARKLGSSSWTVWAAGAAAVVISGGLRLLPGVLAVCVVMIGARIAALDAWNSTKPSAPGAYLRAVRTARALAVSIFLGLTSVYAVGASIFIVGNVEFLKQPWLADDVWQTSLDARTIGTLFALALMVGLLTFPVAAVAELVAGVARQDNELSLLRDSKTRASERQALARQIHDNVLTTVAALPVLLRSPTDHAEAVSSILVRLRGLQYQRHAMSSRTRLGEALRPAEESAVVIGRDIKFTTLGDLAYEIGPQEDPMLERCASTLSQNSIQAGATSIVVSVQVHEPESLAIMVKDDAGGFDPSSALAGFGSLCRLRDELHSVGGSIEFVGTPCSEVHCYFPFDVSE